MKSTREPQRRKPQRKTEEEKSNLQKAMMLTKKNKELQRCTEKTGKFLRKDRENIAKHMSFAALHCDETREG